MKNHYIPQLIINRFSTAVNVFNLDTAEIREKRPSNKIFFTKDIYTDEVENSLNVHLERPFSSLLKRKLLSDGEIEITRNDLMLIKKYMFITSVRCQDLENFCSLLCSLEHNADLFIKIVDLDGFKRKQLKYSKEMLETMSKYDFFNQQMLALTEFDDKNTLTPYELFNDERLSIEMAAWACSFYFSYVAFWDASDDGEFVLSDAGIISEYEGFHLITGGLDISKTSYLLYQMENDKKNGSAYIRSLQTCSVMYENYDLFNISSNRCIVAINPFFRLYDSKSRNGHFEKDGSFVESTLKQPEIWPAIIQNKNLFETPLTKYIVPGFYLPDDMFVYKPKKLNTKEMIYVNSLLINESKYWIGFNEPCKVFSSFEYCLEHESQYKSVTSAKQPVENIIINYANNLMNSKFNAIIKWCLDNGCKTEKDVLDLFQELTDDIFRDFNSNIYIYNYYLKRYDETYNLTQLDFLGGGDKQKKMEYLVAGYNRLLAERGGKI